MAKNEEIIFGACDVYMSEFSGVEIPEDADVETEDALVGHTSGGASIEYKPTPYDVENSYGQVVRRFITKEEITAKTGLLTWEMKKLALLSTAKIKEDAVKKQRVLAFGGKGNKLKSVLIRFVHEKENGKKLRFTMIGQGGNGFTVAFDTKETSIDAELQAIEYVKGFLAEFREELTDEEVAELNIQSVKGE